MKTRKATSFVVAALLASTAWAGDAVPRFRYLPPGFIPVDVFPMDDAWHAFGYPESGLNYYTLAGPESSATPYWERFDPLGSAYQVFAGAYVIRDFEFAAEWKKPNLQVRDIPQTIQRVIGLSIADYYAWNSAYGAPVTTELLPGYPVVVKARDGWFHLLSAVSTFSDLGATEPWFPWVPPYALHANAVDAYQPVVLVADQMIKYDPVHQNLLVVYSNVTHYRLKDGTERHTPLPTVLGLVRTMAGISFE